MTSLRDAAQAALEELEALKDRGVWGDFDGVADALKAALAEYDKDRVKVEEMKANWDLQRKLAKETEERDKQQREYEEQRLAALAEPVQEPVQQALVEADRIMGHDDEATEWRERWAHLFGVAGSATSPWRESAVQDCSPGGTRMPATPPQRPAEPVQEPVAWRWGYRSVTTGEMDWRGYVEIPAHPSLRSPEIIMEPLYTAPPQRKPLTEDEILRLFRTAGSPVAFAHAVEKAHGIE